MKVRRFFTATRPPPGYDHGSSNRPRPLLAIGSGARVLRSKRDSSARRKNEYTSVANLTARRHLDDGGVSFSLAVPRQREAECRRVVMPAVPRNAARCGENAPSNGVCADKRQTPSATRGAFLSSSKINASLDREGLAIFSRQSSGGCRNHGGTLM